MYIFVYIFLEGRRHQFCETLGSILMSFWGASGSKNQKKEVPERCEKTAPKTELQAGEKVTRDAPPRSSRRRAQGGGALKQFQGHPGPHPSPGAVGHLMTIPRVPKGTVADMHVCICLYALVYVRLMSTYETRFAA